MEKMKALVFENNAESSIREVEVPVIEKYEILLKVKTCSICGTDIKLNRGSSIKLTKNGIRKMPFPRITGHEFSGIIKDVGNKVKDFHIGDRINVSPVIPCMRCEFCRRGFKEVCDNKIIIGFDINGAFAEYIAIPDIAINAGCVHSISDNISFEEAALVEPLSVVLNSHEKSKVNKEDTILIIGAGPIGLMQLKVAKLKKLKKIIIADISDYRLKYAEKIDPDYVINNKRQDLLDSVKKISGGDGVDVVMVCASSKELFSDCLKYVKKLGRINYFAGLSKEDSKINIDANLIHYNELQVSGTSDSTPEQNKEAIKLINNEVIDVRDLITHTFSIDDYYKGLEKAQSGEAIKVVIDF